MPVVYRTIKKNCFAVSTIFLLEYSSTIKLVPNYVIYAIRYTEMK